MPVETAKETAKVLVEASSSLGSLWQWMTGIFGAGAIGVWGHITGRIKKLETDAVTLDRCALQMASGDRRFQVLTESHERLLDEVTKIGKAVARIEGMLEK